MMLTRVCSILTFPGIQLIKTEVQVFKKILFGCNFMLIFPENYNLRYFVVSNGLRSNAVFWSKYIKSKMEGGNIRLRPKYGPMGPVL
jgi:hypothetical protein